MPISKMDKLFGTDSKKMENIFGTEVVVDLVLDNDLVDIEKTKYRLDFGACQKIGSISLLLNGKNSMYTNNLFYVHSHTIMPTFCFGFPRSYKYGTYKPAMGMILHIFSGR